MKRKLTHFDHLISREKRHKVEAEQIQIRFELLVELLGGITIVAEPF